MFSLMTNLFLAATHGLNSSFSSGPFGLNGTSVFFDGLAGVKNYRIPAIVQAPANPPKRLRSILVAFAEARAGGDSSSSRIAVRSSQDGGASWLDVTFPAGELDTPAARKACAEKRTACRAGNPAVVYDSVTGEVALIYGIHGFDGGEDALGNGIVTSTDGITWSLPRDITSGFGVAAASMPGPGTALQLAAGNTTGRLLVSSHHGAYQRDYVTVSDDHGSTWRTITQDFPNMDEAALTQLPNGSVLLNMRHRQSPRIGRAVAVSHDGGDTFDPIRYDPNLISPVCQASIVSFDGATYFSNPASTSGRNHITIRKSLDNAVTWSEQLLVEKGSSEGYSCLVQGRLQDDDQISSDFGGILFEASDGTIKFARFPLSLFL